jgi:ubiquinone/menaquinone biosynthesis C-methylase UbiE
MKDFYTIWKKEEKTPFSGWDFSHLKNRMIEEKPPWNYNLLAKRLVKKSTAVLDMGTGGGEIFSSFAPFPARAVATEGYPPNYIIAKKRLRSLNVKVIKFSNSLTRKMPFKKEEFDLILNRHDAFNSNELFRILQNNGIFLTQQVEEKNFADLMKVFGSKPKWKNTLKSNLQTLEKSGFTIKISKEWKGKIEFRDVGSIVYLLKSVPWIVEGFSVEKYLKQLQMLQDRLDKKGVLAFTKSNFLIKAQK